LSIYSSLSLCDVVHIDLDKEVKAYDIHAVKNNIQELMSIIEQAPDDFLDRFADFLKVVEDMGDDIDTQSILFLQEILRMLDEYNYSLSQDHRMYKVCTKLKNDITRIVDTYRKYHAHHRDVIIHELKVIKPYVQKTSLHEKIEDTLVCVEEKADEITQEEVSSLQDILQDCKNIKMSDHYKNIKESVEKIYYVVHEYCHD
jgi:hypothetical protein